MIMIAGNLAPNPLERIVWAKYILSLPFFQHSKHTFPIIIPSNMRGLAACIYYDRLPVSMSLLKASPYPKVAHGQLGSNGAVVLRIKKVLWSADLIRALHWGQDPAAW